MRRSTLVVLAGVTLAAAGGCGITSGGDAAAPSPSATATQRTTTAYRLPADPCAAVPAEVARRFALEKPRRRTYGLFATDKQRPADPLVAFDLLTCEWSVRNPAKGRDGRPNSMTARVAYAALTPDRPNAAEIAAEVFALGREQRREDKDVTVVREGPAPVRCDEGYDVFTTRRSVTGESGEIEVTVRRANAVVTVAFSGADLRIDRSKPRGLQLVTTAVEEQRLRPVVQGILPGALDLL